jgi:2-methylisocitrate lyase-like PEP mutase family enzyme
MLPLDLCYLVLTREQTGAGTTMSRLGMADLGIATLNDMRENAGMIASLDRNIPLIADADTGYGGMKLRYNAFLV